MVGGCPGKSNRETGPCSGLPDCNRLGRREPMPTATRGGGRGRGMPRDAPGEAGSRGGGWPKPTRCRGEQVGAWTREGGRGRGMPRTAPGEGRARGGRGARRVAGTGRSGCKRSVGALGASPAGHIQPAGRGHACGSSWRRDSALPGVDLGCGGGAAPNRAPPHLRRGGCMGSTCAGWGEGPEGGGKGHACSAAAAWGAHRRRAAVHQDAGCLTHNTSRNGVRRPRRRRGPRLWRGGCAPPPPSGAEDAWAPCGMGGRGGRTRPAWTRTRGRLPAR